jgi:hypothetical protein
MSVARRYLNVVARTSILRVLRWMHLKHQCVCWSIWVTAETTGLSLAALSSKGDACQPPICNVILATTAAWMNFYQTHL